MATGPEHFKKAEEMAESAWHYIYGDGGDPVTGAAFATLAQAHATLAQVAQAADARWRDQSVAADWRKAQGIPDA